MKTLGASSSIAGGTRATVAVLLGVFFTVAGVGLYPILFAVVGSSVRSVRFLEESGYVSISMVVLGLTFMAYGLIAYVRVDSSRVKIRGQQPGSAFSLLSQVIGDREYTRISILSMVLYGLFYAYISGILVYRPELGFSTAYHVTVPSSLIVVCCGSLGEVPRLIVYLTDHIGIVVFPISIVLLFTVSFLVGINAGVTVFYYRSRPRKTDLKWFGGIGAVVGLFTGCPTCAGVLLGSLVGGIGVLSAATVLNSLQTLFVMVSIPLLVLAPILTSQALAKAVALECVLKE